MWRKLHSAETRGARNLKDDHRRLHLRALGTKNKHVKCIQVSLHRAKDAPSILSTRFKNKGLEVALIQELWINVGSIQRLLTKKDKLVYNTQHLQPSATLLIGDDTSTFRIYIRGLSAGFGLCYRTLFSTACPTTLCCQRPLYSFGQLK